MPEVAHFPPRRASDPIISRNLIYRILQSAMFIVTGTLLVFYIEMDEGQVRFRVDFLDFCHVTR